MADLDIAYVNPDTSSPVTYEIREFISPSYYKYDSFAIARGRYWSFLLALKSSQTQNIDIALIEPTLSLTDPYQKTRCSGITGSFTEITNLQLHVQEDTYCYGAVSFRGTSGGQPKGYIKGFRYTTAYGTDSLSRVDTGAIGAFTDTNYDKTSSERANYFQGISAYNQMGLLVCVAKNTSAHTWRIIARGFYYNDSTGAVSTYAIAGVTPADSMYENAPLKIAAITGTKYFLVAYETGMRVVDCTSISSLSVGSEFTHGVYDDGAFQLAWDPVNNKGVLWSASVYQAFFVSGTTISSISTGSIPAGLDGVDVQQYINSTVQFIGNTVASPAGFAASTILGSGTPTLHRPINTTLYQGQHVYYEDTNGAADPPSFGLVATQGADRTYVRMFGLTGEPTFPGGFDAPISPWTSVFEGTNQGVVGDFAVTVPWLSVEFSGTNIAIGSFSVSLPKVTSKLSGGGALALGLPEMHAAFTGFVHHFGDIDAALPRLQARFTGLIERQAGFSAGVPSLGALFIGAPVDVHGGFEVRLPSARALFYGSLPTAGDFSADMPLIAARFAGVNQEWTQTLVFSRDAASPSGASAVLNQNNILKFER